jgi:hypothetical protein
MLSTALITAPSFDETSRICAIVAVVDTRRVLRARETTARGVYNFLCLHLFLDSIVPLVSLSLQSFHLNIDASSGRFSLPFQMACLN